jgi:hypothetical protein
MSQYFKDVYNIRISGISLISRGDLRVSNIKDTKDAHGVKDVKDIKDGLDYPKHIITRTLIFNFF